MFARSTIIRLNSSLLAFLGFSLGLVPGARYYCLSSLKGSIHAELILKCNLNKLMTTDWDGRRKWQESSLFSTHERINFAPLIWSTLKVIWLNFVK